MNPAERARSVLRAFRDRLPLGAVGAERARAHALYLLDDMTVAELRDVGRALGLAYSTERRTKAQLRVGISNAAEHIIRSEP